MIQYIFKEGIIVTIEIFAIFASIVLLMYFAYKGVSILILAPALACITVLCSVDSSLLASYTEIFMKKLGGFTATYLPIFMLSAIFGKVVEVTGSAKVIANSVTRFVGKEHAVMSVILSCAIMTYGGISLFVVVFAVYPIASELFRSSNLPKRFIPAAIAVGAFTFTMTALPGTPAIQNIIPGSYFGTNTFAAPGIGIIASLMMLFLGYGWINCEIRKAISRGEKYSSEDKKSATIGRVAHYKANHIAAAFIPVVAVILLNFICSKYIFPNVGGSMLNPAKYGNVDLKSVISNWAIITALFCAIFLSVAFNYKKFKTLKRFLKVLNEGIESSFAPIFNTASVVGYGAVINSLSAFNIIKNFIIGINAGVPTVSIAIATGVLAGITGSASGGMIIALDSLAKTYMEMAAASGIDPELIHRIVAVSSGSLDTLPHNGAVITLLAICKLTHKESYKDIFVVSLLVPAIVTAAIIIICACFGSF